MNGVAGPKAVVHGPPGSLAPEIARELSERWGVPVWETDAQVERRLGASVADLFVSQGEEAFRSAEYAAVVEGLATDGVVLLLGSGAVSQPAVAELLAPVRSRVVFVDVTLTEAARRLGFVGGPPALGSPRGSWQRLMTQRRPAYEAVSGHRAVVDADGLLAAVDHLQRALQEGTA